METLDGTTWDLVISGTGLSQSLLALALSRSGKRILHLDKNDYYGGSETALSLQEAEEWVKAVDSTTHSSFRNASIRKPVAASGNRKGSIPKLAFSRAYSLSLSPQLIYTRSNLLPALVTARVHHQLEFLAVGSWWMLKNGDSTSTRAADNGEKVMSPCMLQNIPGSREDVFADKSIDLKSKRSLMNFLRLAADAERHSGVLDSSGLQPFPDFLKARLGIPEKLQPPLLALTLSSYSPAAVPTAYALPRIHRHLTSIGLFGPGFGSVIPKWGGMAEIAQVACRAGAVGGSTYVLGRGIEEVSKQDVVDQRLVLEDPEYPLKLYLPGGESIKTHWLAGALHNLPAKDLPESSRCATVLARSISIISSSLSSLFPISSEGAPPSAGAVVVIPAGSIHHESFPGSEEPPPIYLMVHSSDTGECPDGQSIVYASIIGSDPAAFELLDLALQNFLKSIDEDPGPTLLWSMQYTQQYFVNPTPATASQHHGSEIDNHILFMPDLTPDLALEDSVLNNVRAAWQRVTGQEESFMIFNERDQEDNDEVDEL